MAFIITAGTLAVVSALLYRAGGQGKEPDARPKWMPMWMRKSWVRDWLCPACVLIPLAIVKPTWWMIPVYGLMGGALSTFWDFITGKDNFYLAGMGCGLSTFPLIFGGYPWWGVLIATAALAGIWGLWSEKQDIDWVEEMGRGFFLVFSTAVILSL